MSATTDHFNNWSVENVAPAGERKHQNVLQALAAALYSVPASFMLTYVSAARGVGPYGLVLPFVLAIIIAIFATRLSLWVATVFYGVVLACEISILYLWISHSVAGRDVDATEYAHTIAYAGLGLSAYILFGMLFSFDSRLKILYRGRAIAILTSVSAILVLTATYAFARDFRELGYIIILFFAIPSCLQSIAVWTSKREESHVPDETRANAE